MIDASAIGWKVGGAQILEDVSIHVGAGELLGIIGPSGAGKSSLVNILSGVRVLTARPCRTTTRSIARRRYGPVAVASRPRLFDGLTIGENVRLAIQASGRPPFSPFRRAGAAWARIEALLEQVRMPGRADLLARDLSHGDRRKLELAMSLASEPAVLLLDEPMAGVSAEDVDEITEIIGEVRDSGVAVAMVEHHMHVVLGLADRVAVLHHGQLLATGAPAEVTQDERVQQAYAGLHCEQRRRRSIGGPPVLSLEGVHVHYGGSHILQGLVRRRFHRGDRPARTQRRRQDDHAQGSHRAAPPWSVRLQVRRSDRVDDADRPSRDRLRPRGP